MSFVIMGFVDVVGVATGYVKSDFNLTDDLAQLIPSMALIWFFLLSVPTGLLQDRFGKKRILLIGTILAGTGMLVPFTSYSFPVMLLTFILMGIGNTMLQVSANPLMHDIVQKEKFSSYMSFSQFVKALSSLLGPIITTMMASAFGNWKLVFLVYSATTLISALWLYLTNIREAAASTETATFQSCFKLLKNRFILVMALGIFCLVGADVAMNSNIANYLQTVCNLNLEEASLGISLYFMALMIGRFLGALILNWISPTRFLLITSLVALTGIIVMLIAPSVFVGKLALVVVGFGSGNLFPLIFAITLQKMPHRANEISGLMMMAVSGGAFIPPVMGMVSKYFGVVPSFFVLLLVMLYLVAAGIYSKKNKI